MAYATIDAVNRFRTLLEQSGGLRTSLAALSGKYGRDNGAPADFTIEPLRVPGEILEKALSPKHPVVLVYCDQIESRRTEKLRPFSGRMRLVTEIRVSQDRLEGITETLYFYLDAVRDVVEKSTGCGGGGIYLDGEYEVTIEAVRKGGLYFQQVAKIACWVMLNRS